MNRDVSTREKGGGSAEERPPSMGLTREGLRVVGAEAERVEPFIGWTGAPMQEGGWRVATQGCYKTVPASRGTSRQEPGQTEIEEKSATKG
ncbi:hypothetical protein SLA2020_443140 [Shorea laevis]